jgi:FHS family L-fucose permease-like MFS transporter
MAGGAPPTNITALSLSGRSKAKETAFSHLPPRKIVYPFALVTSLFFLWGFAYGLLDVLNKHLQNVLGITKLQSTGLQVAYFGIGYFAFSPVAGEVLRRRGYKFTIVMGLSFYSLGAIMFWPCAHFVGEHNRKAIFGGFVVCTAIIACGLASLETAANSYITVLPGTAPDGAAFRLQFSQSFNGVASFAGPFIASKYFFTGENASNLVNVQYVYLAVSLLGLIVGALFIVSPLPETSEQELQAEVDKENQNAGRETQANDSFFRQYRPLFGFVAQFMYVGAQVTIGSFFINYCAEVSLWPDAKSSNFLSYALIMFTVSRFIGSFFLAFISAELLVGIYSTLCLVMVVLATVLKGTGGVACLMLVLFFEAPLFPSIFVISTIRLGKHTRRASSLLISAVGGGAVFPPIQGAIADRHGTRISYALNIPAFAYIAGFGFFLWAHNRAYHRRIEKPIKSPQLDTSPAGDGKASIHIDEEIEPKK